MNSHIKSIHRLLGAVDAAEFIKATSDVAIVTTLKRIKDNSEFRELGYNTWEEFCKSELGVSRRTIDEKIQNIKELGEQFFESASNIGLTTQQFRTLRKAQLTGDIELNQSEGVVKIGNEIIPLTPASADDLHEAINNLLDEKTTEIERLEKTVKSKDQLLELKDKTLKIAESEVKELTQKTKPTPDESVKKLRTMKAEIEIHIKTLDPEEPLLNLHTVASKAEYASFVTWLHQQVTALYEHASDAYGFSSDGWTPPGE